MLALHGENRARMRLDERLYKILCDEALVKHGGDAVELRSLVGVGAEAEARCLGADIDLVLLGKLARFFDKGGEVEIRVGARGGRLGLAHPLGGGTAALQLALHRSVRALRAGEVILNRGGDPAGGRRREIGHRLQFRFLQQEFFLRRARGCEALVDQRTLGEREERAEREAGGEERIFAKPGHARSWTFTQVGGLVPVPALADSVQRTNAGTGTCPPTHDRGTRQVHDNLQTRMR